MLRKLQSIEDVVIHTSMMLQDGTQATSLDISSFTTAIVRHDGTAIVNYTAPTITNPVSKGEYFLSFPTAANSTAFTLVNEPNPYAVTLDHPETNVEPMTMELWITDRYPWELSKSTEVGSNLTAIQSLDTRVSSVGAQVNSVFNLAAADEATVVDLTGITEGDPRVEAGDAFQFKRNFGTVPNSVGVRIYDPTGTLVESLQTASQSGTSANFYFFYTTTTSWFTTVDTYAQYVFEWTAFRSTGNDIEKDYFEVIQTD